MSGRRIYKYLIPTLPNAVVQCEVPKDSELIHIGQQDGHIYGWFLVPSAEEHQVLETWDFLLAFTGANVDEIADGREVEPYTTIQTPDGLVWHVLLFSDDFQDDSVTEDLPYAFSDN